MQIMYIFSQNTTWNGSATTLVAANFDAGELDVEDIYEMQTFSIHRQLDELNLYFCERKFK